MAKIQMKDMIILVPGILGSVLQKNGQDIWNLSLQAALGACNRKIVEGSFFDQLAIQEDDIERDYLDDGIKATGLIQDACLVPGFIKIIDGYSSLRDRLTQNFDVISGKNYFEFAYDWRRDNRVSARLLKKLIDKHLPRWQEKSPGAKVILIAHSMGGLVCRYYLEQLGGGECCKALFSLGTPYRGSVKILDFLANDYRKVQILGLKDVLASFSSTYQLLPMYPVVEVNQQWQRVAETIGIPGVETEKAEEAREFLQLINLKENLNYTNSYQFKPIIGVGQKNTLQSTNLSNGRLTASNKLLLNSITQQPLDVDRITGDDTVPFVSAIPIDLSEKLEGLYCGESHCALQSNVQIWNLLKDFLSRLQGNLKDFQNPQITQAVIKQPSISLTVDDLYLRDEEVILGAEIVNVDVGILRRKRNFGGLRAIITSVSDKRMNLEEDFMQQGNGFYQLSLRKKLPPGLYRLEVETNKADDSAPEAVHNLFQVME